MHEEKEKKNKAGSSSAISNLLLPMIESSLQGPRESSLRGTPINTAPRAAALIITQRSAAATSPEQWRAQLRAGGCFP